MAYSITDDPTWAKIVGEATLDNSGRIGDLLSIGFAHVGQEMISNRLTQVEAGHIYTALIPAAFNSALQYEATIQKHLLDRIKIHAEVEKHWGYDVTVGVDENLDLGANSGLGVIDEQYNKLKYEVDTLLPDTHVTNIKQQTLLDTEEELKTQQILTETENTALVTENTALVTENTILVTEKHESEAMNNMPGGVIEQQISKMIEDVLISKEKVLISKEEVKIAISKESREYTEMVGNVDKVLGYNYTLDSSGNIIRHSLTDAGDGKLDSDVNLINQNIAVGVAQESEIYAGTIRANSKQSDNELTSAKSREQTDQQILVLKRQVIGYDDDKRQKVMTSLLNFSSIVGQDHEVPVLPSIIATNQGVDELVRMATRDNTTPYNSRPIAANVNRAVLPLVAGRHYDFSMGGSFDLDHTLDYNSVNLNGTGFTAVFPQGTYRYIPSLRITRFTSSNGSTPPTIAYSIKDITGLESYTAVLTFSARP